MSRRAWPRLVAALAALAGAAVAWVLVALLLAGRI
jgi:hypothetical protein